MTYEENTIKSEMVYEGRILNLRIDTVELPNRKYSKREIVEHNNAVAIIAIKDNRIFFIKQYRKAVNKVLLEIPAGLIDANESPREAALRELQEEIGYGANKLEFLFDGYSSPGFTDEKTSYFLAQDLFESKLEADDDEYLEVLDFDIDEALKMIDDGEIEDTKTITGILYVYRKFMTNDK
ncbi:MAG: NUDIX hydrolase [Miniphocaeibacter sp.]|jgi:ADP-ribose pyrophosphatase|uniref:NUDIX hydrolase n=1 Tax=Miniphocaeibacter sp. TaxID=3100973 RepID=UPI0018013A9F|nr:NUDIX hydrolase [Gallicola sp.]